MGRPRYDGFWGRRVDRRHFLRLAALSAGTAALVAACGRGPSSRPATFATETPTPTGPFPRVSGPIEGGRRGMPFNYPAVDLASRGYVAQEFFLEGEATSYRPAPGATLGNDGLWRAEPADTAPYRTRILVVRPLDDSRFNGTVLVNWQNVTAGFEIGTVGEGEILRGYAWVGVSAQRVGVEGFASPEARSPLGLGTDQHLKAWDPERYGSLQHPGDPYSYDIFTQAARAVGPQRPRTTPDPMGGLTVRRLVATGLSQSAARLRTYINAVHPLVGVFQGFIPYLDFGWGIRLDEQSVPDVSGVDPRIRVPTVIRQDQPTPVMVVNSETETVSYYAVRQPDSPSFRFWEVAGTSHTALPRGTQLGGVTAPNWLSVTPVYHAAVRHMHNWLVRGTPPPVLPRIEVEPGNPPRIRRDARGNALGGIRLPELEAPIGEHRGVGEGGSLLAILAGYFRPFTCRELASLYTSREAFVRAYQQAVDAGVAAGYILPEDAAAMKEAAARTDIFASCPAG